MSSESSSKISAWTSIRRLLALSGRSQYWLYAAMLAAVLNTALVIAWNLSLARNIDAVQAGNYREFFYYLALAVGFFAATIPLAALRAFSAGSFSEHSMAKLRDRIAARATLLPMAYLEDRHSGDLLGVVNADLAKLKTLMSDSLVGVVSQTLMALAALAALISISWQLTLASTILIPAMFLIMSKINQPVAQRSEELQQKIGEMLSVSQDALAGLMVTRAFNLEKVMDDRFHLANQMALGRSLVLARLRAATDGGGSVFGVLPFLVTFGFGGYLAINGYLSFGSLMIFITMLNYVANPLSSLPPLLASIAEASGAAQRMYQILDQPTERSGGLGFPQVEPGTPVVRIDQLNFSYGEEPILKEVSLSVQPGQTLAVVGPSGGGKSTLLKCLLGYYAIADHQAFLFGQDLNQWSLPAARDQMSVVAQDTYLFPVSIAENIACGKPGAGQDEIERAARMANIHDYIASLPQGYQTLVGERGARLSGGQRQRLALARAILKNAPVLLLDEPTSALDTESEALVQEALDRFMRDRTTVVIAHRLSTIRKANWVVVLDEGRILEEGTHADLLASGGRYKDLYLRQFGSAGLTAAEVQS